MRTRRILSGCDGRTTPTTETTRTRMFARPFFFFWFFALPAGSYVRCPRRVRSMPSHRYTPGRVSGGTRGRDTEPRPFWSRSPSPPPRRDPARPSEKKTFADAAALSRESVAPRAGGGGGEDPRLRTRASEVWLGFGFGFGFDARWNRPTRRETKADRETRHRKRRRRRSQTRGETRRVHLYFCINTGKKRRIRPCSSSSRRARRRRVSECDRADHIHPQPQSSSSVS